MADQRRKTGHQKWERGPVLENGGSDAGCQRFVVFLEDCQDIKRGMMTGAMWISPALVKLPSVLYWENVA